MSQIARASISITDLAERLNLALSPDGTRYRCVCPVHADTNPSLVFYPEDNSWFCFGCQQGGGLVELVKFVNQCTYDEAIQWLGWDPDDAMDRLMSTITEVHRVTQRTHDPDEVIERATQARRLRKLRPTDVSEE